MRRIVQAAFLPVLAVAVCLAQQDTSTSAASSPAPKSATYVGKAIGKATVEKTPSLTTINLYANQHVESDTVNHLHVISRGNTIIFTPNSNFQTRINAFDLNSGGTKVASYTGMTTYLPKCFSVSPVDPNLLTLYEVDWLQSDEAIVYARSQDVTIHYYANHFARYNEAPKSPTKDWVVKEGHYARIPDVPLCQPILYFGPEPSVVPITAMAIAGPATAVTIWQLYETTPPKPNVSQASP